MPKKTAAKQVAGERADVQRNFDRLHMAHQVHTLAQRLYHQLALAAYPQGARVALPGVPAPAPYAEATHPLAGWPAWQATGLGPEMPRPQAPAFFYWYP